MGGPTESIFNHPVCSVDMRPEKVDIRVEDHKGEDMLVRRMKKTIVFLELAKVLFLCSEMEKLGKTKGKYLLP